MQRSRLVIVGMVVGVASAVADRAPEPQQPPAASRSVPRAGPPPSAGPTLAPEIAQRGKELAGTYRCKGVTMRGDGSSTPLVASLAIKLDLDGAWIQTSFAEDKGVKFTTYSTYDGVAKQWTRIQLASTSGHIASTSLGEQNGKWTWEGSATSPVGTVQIREYEQRDGRDLKLWAEALLGGSWQKLYEVSCKKP